MVLEGEEIPTEKHVFIYTGLVAHWLIQFHLNPAVPT